MSKLARVFGKTNEGVGKTCPSCEEGNHQRCRDRWCDCCSGSQLREVFKVREANDNPGMMAKAKAITPAAASQNLRKAADNISKMGTATMGGSSGPQAGGMQNQGNQNSLKFMPATNEPNERTGKLVTQDTEGNAQEYDLGTNQMIQNPELSKNKGALSTMKKF